MKATVIQIGEVFPHSSDIGVLLRVDGVEEYFHVPASPEDVTRLTGLLYAKDAVTLTLTIDDDAMPRETHRATDAAIQTKTRR